MRPSGSVRYCINLYSTPGSRVGSAPGSATESKELSEKAEKRKKKKSFYAKLKRQEDDKMAELAAKYRDRAAERRDGGTGELIVKLQNAIS